MQITSVLISQFRDIARDQRGATAIEYGLLAAMIAVGSITALESLGASLGETFGTVEESMGGQAAAENPPTAAPEQPPVAPAMTAG